MKLATLAVLIFGPILSAVIPNRALSEAAFAVFVCLWFTLEILLHE